ncbi:RNA-directed DNA polymerase, eukaryota [Tanacetum coccineum]|uniref:RNA-directed DNA polymerase, eukaryota n=1 Tax=Tanacetum coccineum TaxID=301880 RepID=A0ABQ5DSY2_9ASTR
MEDQTLFSGGRLTLLKSVLTALPFYYMSIYKAPVAVLKDLESICRDFFHGADKVDRKMVWVHWEKVLASKNSGGLGVSSLYATNQALLFKWIWRFLTQCSSLWSSLIKAIHGVKRNIDDSQTKISGSIWQELVREFVALKSKVGDLAGELVVEELIVREIIVGELMLGELMSCLLFLEEGYLHTKRICIKTKLAENIYESFKIIIRGKIFWIRAKEISGWIPEFEDDDDEDSQSDVEMSKNGSIDEDGGTFKFPNVEDESDCEEVAETIFEKNQSSANMKEDYVGVQKDTSSEDPFNIFEILNKKKDTKNGDSIYDNNLKYPPGFTPANDDEAQNNPLKESNEERDNSVLNDVPNSKDDKVESNVKKDSLFNSSKNDTGRSWDKLWVTTRGCTKNIGDIIDSQRVNDENKMENIELFNIKSCWGNFGFEYEHSPSVGNSGGILCIWDPSLFRKSNSTISDYIVTIQGEWLLNVLNNWNGEVVIMGDFNEVRTQEEIYESIFDIQGADAFNLFISFAGLEEAPLDGCKFTWCHKSAAKMSKLDRFLISESLMSSCPNISAITLDRYLFDHKPILMRESHFDYGPIPFHFFHYWFDLDGFDNFVEQTWKNAQVTDMNAMSKLMKKLKFLKEQIRM